MKTLPHLLAVPVAALGVYCAGCHGLHNRPSPKSAATVEKVAKLEAKAEPPIAAVSPAPPSALRFRINPKTLHLLVADGDSEFDVGPVKKLPLAKHGGGQP